MDLHGIPEGNVHGDVQLHQDMASSTRFSDAFMFRDGPLKASCVESVAEFPHARNHATCDGETKKN